MVSKSTNESYKTELFMPIMKAADGKYIAVLSDDSIDRDEEKLSKSCIEKLGQDPDYVAALLNHDNNILNLVAEWTNRKVVDIDGHTALIAEPKFYKSNPKAQIIKGMLDEGAKPGVSIGAIVKNYDDVNGMRVFTELELVEASFVGIPSNKHGRAMAVAKSYNKAKEAKTMEKEFTQKDIDSAVEKKMDEVKADYTKQLESKDVEIAKLKKDAEEAKKEGEKAKEEGKEEAKEEAKEEKAESEKKLKEAQDALEKEKKASLEKLKFADQGGDKEPPEEEAKKAMKEGKLPFTRMM